MHDDYMSGTNCSQNSCRVLGLQDHHPVKARGLNCDIFPSFSRDKFFCVNSRLLRHICHVQGYIPKKLSENLAECGKISVVGLTVRSDCWGTTQQQRSNGSINHDKNTALSHNHSDILKVMREYAGKQDPKFCTVVQQQIHIIQQIRNQGRQKVKAASRDERALAASRTSGVEAGHWLMRTYIYTTVRQCGRAGRYGPDKI